MLVFESLEQRRLMRRAGAGAELTGQGRKFCTDFGIDLGALAGRRRPLCRACLDWSVRRHHLAGSVGAALLERYLDLGWAKRAKGSRVVSFSAAGERFFRARFGLPAH